MFRVIDESRRNQEPSQGLGQSLTFDEGIKLIEALPESIYVQVFYGELDENVRKYWRGKHNRSSWSNKAEVTPKEAIEFVKNQFISDNPVAVCVDYQVRNFYEAGKRLKENNITFELYDEIFGIIGKEITLDLAPAKSQTVMFYERTNLPGIKNWLARKLAGEQFNSLDFLVWNH